MNDEQNTEATVRQPAMGANGIPDLPAEADAAKRPSAASGAASSAALQPRRSEPGSWVDWVAVGAIVLGTIGMVVGLTSRSRRRRHDLRLYAVPDPHALTPPHGDKLMHHRLH